MRLTFGSLPFERARRQPAAVTAGSPSFLTLWRQRIPRDFPDGGFEPAKTFVLNYILNDIEHKQLFYDNSKTILQELIQGETDEEIVYTILKEEGPDHDKSFWAQQVSVGRKRLGTGKGRTKSGRTGSGMLMQFLPEKA